MRALISLIAGSMLLNLSAHAISRAKENEESFEIPEDENELEEKSWGLNKAPQDYENQLEN